MLRATVADVSLKRKRFGARTEVKMALHRLRRGPNRASGTIWDALASVTILRS